MLFVLVGSSLLFLITLVYYIAKFKILNGVVYEWIGLTFQGKDSRKIHKAFYNLYSCAPILSFSLGIVLGMIYYWLHTTYCFAWSIVYALGIILGLSIVLCACLRRHLTSYIKRISNNTIQIKITNRGLSMRFVPTLETWTKGRELTVEEIDTLLQFNDDEL